MRDADCKAHLGIIVWGEEHEHEEQGELVFSWKDGPLEQRVYKFNKEGYPTSYCTATNLGTKDVVCPGCDMETQSFPNGLRKEMYDQEHEDHCKFDPAKLNEMYLEANKGYAGEGDWAWGDFSYTLEAEVIKVFAFSKLQRQPQYKEFEKMIKKIETNLLKKHNPEAFAEQQECEANWRKARKLEKFH